MHCDNSIPETHTNVEEIPDLPDNIPPLRSLYLYLTDFCNLRCRHCWITPQFTRTPIIEDYIHLEDIKRIIFDSKNLGLKHVKLSGGEPLLHPNFLDIIELLNQHNIAYNIETNGTLLSGEIVDKINLNLNLGVSVSLDSCNPEKHDDFRGVNGAFNLALQGIELLVNAGIKTQIIMSIHSGNINEIDEMANLIEDVGANSLKFNPILEIGKGIAIRNQGIKLSYDDLIKINNYVKTTLQPQHSVKLHLNIPAAFNRIQHFLKHGSGKSTCGILNVLGVLGTGEFALCGVGKNINELCFGKISENNLFDVWTSNPVLIELRDSLSKTLPGICGDCIHASRCMSSCVANNYFYSGKLVSPDPMCDHYEKRKLFPVSRRKSIP